MRFKYLDQGDIFLLEDKVFIKIETLSGTYNAADLCTGEIEHIYEHENVMKADMDVVSEWREIYAAKKLDTTAEEDDEESSEDG